MKNHSIAVILKFYRALSGIKHQLLITVFGYSSYCKHDPTCSRYLEKQLKSHGTIVGLWRGLRRMASCW